MSIKLLFSEIVDEQKLLGYHFPSILKPAALLDSIKKIELELNLKFNDELFELYTFAEGTTIDDETPNGKTGLIPIHSFLNLNDAKSYYDNYINQQELFTHWETQEMPGKKLFPFLEDSAGNCYWVDLNDTENHGKVYWTNSFGESPDYTFESLTAFFQTVLESYKEGVMFLDEDGYLEYDDLDFARIAEKHNPKLPYWTKFLAEQ